MYILTLGDEMTTVYIDVLFLINFSLDYMVIFLCGKLFHLDMKRSKNIVASICMAIYAVWALLWCGSYLLLILTYIFVLLLACLYVYRVRNAKVLLKLFFMFNTLSALLGALIYLLYRFLSYMIPPVIEGNGGGIKVVVFTVLAGISGVCIYFGNILITETKGEKCIDVTLAMNGKEYILHLLVDSGNIITDPISGRKVIVISSRCASRIFGKRINEMDYLSSRRRWICVHGVGGTKALQAFLPENITCKNTQIGALLAISQEDDFQGYEGLFPVSLLP